MNELTKEDVKFYLKAKGIDSSYAHNIMKKKGKDGLINREVYKTIEDNLHRANKWDNNYRPKSIFDDSFFSPDELVSYIDWQLGYIKNKYNPFGLKLPFSSLENAHEWLKEESLNGILTTARIKNATQDIDDFEVYKSSLILMPYRLRSNNNNGINSPDAIICNNSPFLLELNSVINRLNVDTGINKISILNHFLCNHDIEIKRVEGIIAADTLNQYFIFQINTNDLSKNEWDEIYNSYRLNINRKHKKKLSNNNIILSEIIDSIDIPEKVGADFYRLLIKKWNEKTGDNMSVDNWRTMRNRFKTVMEYRKDTSTIKSSILEIIKKTKEEE